MKTAIIIAISLFAVSSASAEDAWTRLRNASANELCWDAVRNIAREKFPSVKVDEPSPTLIGLARPASQTPIKQRRKDFDGIRSC